jgi:hypothetical protein
MKSVSLLQTNTNTPIQTCPTYVYFSCIHIYIRSNIYIETHIHHARRYFRCRAVLVLRSYPVPSRSSFGSVRCAAAGGDPSTTIEAAVACCLLACRHVPSEGDDNPSYHCSLLLVKLVRAAAVPTLCCLPAPRSVTRSHPISVTVVHLRFHRCLK